MDRADGREAYCPFFQRTIELIGKRWTGAVLLALAAGERHPVDIRRAIPGLSDRLLVERLRELEAEGVVDRNVQGRAVAYTLTEKGRGLIPVLDSVSAYASTWAATSGVPADG